MAAKWEEIKVGDVVSPTMGELARGDAGLPVSGVSTDSREILPGMIFLALKGEIFDGHEFVIKAIERGASCVVVEQGYEVKIPPGLNAAVVKVQDTLMALGDLASWWRHRFDVKVAAITGSAGKTTAKEMAARILELTSKTLKNKGNLNNLIGLPMTVFELEEDVAKMVLEMGMNRPGEIGRLTEIADPDVGLITNVGMAHIEGLGNISGVARAKTELIEKISPRGKVILNGDDELLMNEASRFKIDVMTFGLRPENDVRAVNINSLGKDGVSFELRYKGDAVQALLPVPGIHNVLNALAAASIALAMGEPFANIPDGLKGYDALKGRFKIISLAHNVTLVDDTYNANPSSLRASLNSVKEMAKGGKRVIVGLGEMLELGKETVQAHIDAGKMASDIGAAWFFAMGEHAHEMVKGAVSQGFSPERALKVESHGEMIDKIGEVLTSGDIIFLKGSRRMGLESVVRGLEDRWPSEVKHDRI
jgi:UDP-N-acetylmuramoyl-tripeptide--D-alanyl-D-alanine ligase